MWPRRRRVRLEQRLWFMPLVDFKERYTRKIYQVVNSSMERFSIQRNGGMTWYWRINALALLGMVVLRMFQIPLNRCYVHFCWLVLFSAQFIPMISDDSSVEVVNFCRTPQWYVPRVCLSFAYYIWSNCWCHIQCQKDFRYPAWIQWMFAHVPFLMRWYRNWIMASVSILTSDPFTQHLKSRAVRYSLFDLPKGQ